MPDDEPDRPAAELGRWDRDMLSRLRDHWDEAYTIWAESQTDWRARLHGQDQGGELHAESGRELLGMMRDHYAALPAETRTHARNLAQLKRERRESCST